MDAFFPSARLPRVSRPPPSPVHPSSRTRWPSSFSIRDPALMQLGTYIPSVHSHRLRRRQKQGTAFQEYELHVSRARRQSQSQTRLSKIAISSVATPTPCKAPSRPLNVKLPTIQKEPFDDF